MSTGWTNSNRNAIRTQFVLWTSWRLFKVHQRSDWSKRWQVSTRATSASWLLKWDIINLMFPHHISGWTQMLPAVLSLHPDALWERAAGVSLSGHDLLYYSISSFSLFPPLSDSIRLASSSLKHPHKLWTIPHAGLLLVIRCHPVTKIQQWEFLQHMASARAKQYPLIVTRKDGIMRFNVFSLQLVAY